MKVPPAQITPLSGETVLYTSLSLFIILLAFFMVLTSHSDFNEERVRPVLQSLEQTFTTRVFENSTGPSFVDDPALTAGDGYAALENLAQLFKAETAGIEPQLIPSRGFLSLEIDESVFRKISDDMNNSVSPASVSAIIMRVLKGSSAQSPQMQMEIWVSLNDKASNKKSLVSADKFITTLVRQDIDAGRISLGTSADIQSGKILLLFRPYKPYGVVG